MVFVDLSKTLARETTIAILGCSNLIMYTFPQNMAQIQDYIQFLQILFVLFKSYTNNSFILV